MSTNIYSNETKLTLAEEDEDERDVLAPKRPTSTIFTREGSSRLSMQFHRNQTGYDVRSLKFVSRRIHSDSSHVSQRLIITFENAKSRSKWIDTADRMMNNRVFSLSLPRELRRKEPSSSLNVHRTAHYASNQEKYAYTKFHVW